MEKRSSTVFVANLPFNTTEDQLKEIFEDIGPLKTIRIVTDRDTGRQRGFSFLEFHDVTTAEAAVRNLNEHDLNGRKLKVHFAANDMDSKSRSQGKGGLLSKACLHAVLCRHDLVICSHHASAKDIRLAQHGAVKQSFWSGRLGVHGQGGDNLPHNNFLVFMSQTVERAARGGDLAFRLGHQTGLLAGLLLRMRQSWAQRCPTCPPCCRAALQRVKMRLTAPKAVLCASACLMLYSKS